MVLAACQPKVVETPKEAPPAPAVAENTVVPAPTERLEIIYYDRTSAAPRWADAYNQSQDKVNVRVEIQPPGTRYEQLVAAILADNPPDVIGLDCVQVGRFALLNALAPLDDLIAEETRALYFPSLVNKPGHYGNYEGRLLGVPFWGDMSAVYYNKAILNEAGGDPEAGIRSWDDYVTYGKRVTTEGIFGLSVCCCIAHGFLYYPWIWAQGGDLFDPGLTEATVDTPEVKSTLQFARDLVLTYKIVNDPVSDWGTMTDIFTGRKAMVVHNGGGLVGLSRSEFPELWEVLGTCPIPGQQVGQKSSFIGGNVASMSPKCKEKEAAIDFIVWATTSTEGMAVTGEVGYLPGCPAGLDLPVFRKDWHIYAAFKDGLENGYPFWNDPRVDELASPVNDAFCAACEGKQSIEEIVATLEQRLNEILQRA
jgi:ABC-type glycerol-3-phosphate transport system substrate-binding protein